MAGEGQKVNAHLLHGNGSAARGLGGVQQKIEIVSPGKGGRPIHIQQVARQVGGVGAHQKLGVGPHQLLKPLILQLSLPVSGEKVRFHTPFPGQHMEGAQHRVVVPVGGNDVVSRIEKAKEGGVQCLGGVGGEDDPLRVGEAEEFGQSLPGLKHGACGGHLAGVAAPGAVAQVAHGLHHRLGHTGGLLEGGGGVIEVNHRVTNRSAVVRISAMRYMLVTLPMASLSFRP